MSNMNTPPDFKQSKDTQFKNELTTIFQYLQENVCTASMLSEATGIKQKNICRYKRDLEAQGHLKELYRNYCKTTGFKAWYITADKTKFPSGLTQYNLFNHD